MQAGLLIDERFELVEFAGTGAMGEVWRARDLDHGGWVAVKVLRLGNAEVHRLEREARSLEALRVPGVVGHVAHGQFEERPYLVMEWLAGETLAERQVHTPLDVTSSVKLGAELSIALSHAHSAGIVHRDVKLSNVMLTTPDLGGARLIDFGIALTSDPDDHPTTFGRAIGTPGFMAPEQARGEAIDGRTDLFALGCLLYTLLAGVRPFRGSDPIAAMAASLTQPTPLLSRVRGDLPAALVDLVSELMAKQIEERPRSADRVAERLALVLAAGSTAGLPAPSVGEIGTQLGSTQTGLFAPCFGREAELQRLSLAYTFVVKQRQPTALMLSGPAGVGKTRLLEELLTEAAGLDEPPEVWMAGAAAESSSAPLSLVAAAARNGLISRGVRDQPELERTVRARLVPSMNATDAARIAPFLLTLLTGETSEESTLLQAAHLDPRLMATQLRRGLTAWLELAALERPLLLALEDIHLADAASLEFVTHLLRELVDVPLFVVMTCRSDVNTSALSSMVEAGVEFLRLAELSGSAARRLAEYLAPELGPADIEDLLRRSGGLPLFVEQLALHGVEAGCGTLGEVVRARLSNLHPTLRAVTSQAAVLASDFSAASLAAVSGGELEGTQQALLELVRAGLLRTSRTSTLASDGRRYSFRHDLVRDAAYSALDPALRARTHSLAGDELAKEHTEPARVAHHLDCSGDPAKAAKWHALAAIRALQRADLARAEQHAARGLEGATTSSLRGELELVQCTLHNLRGEAEAAARAGERALVALNPKCDAWLSAAAELAVARARLGDSPALRAVARQVLVEIPLSDPSLESVSCWERIAVELAYVAEHELALQLLRACEIAGSELPTNAALTARLHDARSTRAYIEADDVACQAAILAALKSYDGLGDVHRACEREVFLGWSQLELGQLSRAETTLQRASERAARRDLRVFEVSALQNLGLALALRGRLGDAIRVERDALTRELTHQHRRLRVGCHEILARILLLAGDAEGAREHARLALTMLEGRAPQRAPCLALLAQSELRLEELQAAVEHAQAASRLLTEVGGVESTEKLWVLLAQADVFRAAGSLEAATEHQGRARRLVLSRAARISDSELRETFLRDGPECARALE